MECFQCGAANPEEQKYCGTCGTPLDPDLARVHAYLGQSLKGKVREVIKEELKDRDVAATEITEDVTTKLVGWAKLLAFAIGIPLALVTLALTTLGISTYQDFKTNIENLKAEVSEDLEVTWEGVQKLRARLNENRALIAEVEALRSRVRSIEEKFGFSPSPDLSPELEQNIKDSLAEFISYLGSLGYQHKGGPVGIVVNKEVLSDNAFYDAAENKMVIAPAFARDRQVIFHTYASYAFQSIFDKESPLRQSEEAAFIGFALADYFACSHSDQPLLGEIAVRESQKIHGYKYTDRPYFRNLANYLSFTDDKTFDDRDVWGGLFWELRYLFRQEIADQVLYSSWTTFARTTTTPSDLRTAFARIVLENCRRHVPEGRLEEVRSVFQRRGLTI